MYTYKDIEQVNEFIQGMTESVKETTEEQVAQGNELPDTIVFLLKRPNENGDCDYGMGGGIVPSDELGKTLHNQIVPTIIKHQGNEILCSCETKYLNGVLTIKFHNNITDEKHEEVFNLFSPTQRTDNTFMTIGDIKISLN